MAGRRAAASLASRFTNRRFVFALAVVSVLGAKAVHIHTHVTALSRVHLLRWGYSFFAQDLFLLVLIRLLLDSWVFAAARPFKSLATFGASVLLAFVIALGAFNVSFFIVSGSEIHWRNIALAGDSSSWSMFLSGTLSLMLVVFLGLVASCVLQDVVFALFGLGSDLVKWPVAAILQRTPWADRLAAPGHESAYGLVPQQDDDVEHGSKEGGASGDDGSSLGVPPSAKWEMMQRYALRQWLKLSMYLFIGCALAGQVICFLIRPHESSLVFMSWTSALLPFVDFSDSSPHLKNMVPVYNSGIGRAWDNMTAVHNSSSPAGMPWSLARTLDFWQRYVPERHYSAAHDPLRISNAKEGLLADLSSKLAGVPIRHVVIVFLESTRKDVFPLKKNGLIWRRLVDSFENHTLPDQVANKLASLTPNANYITGDYNDGFPHAKNPSSTRGRGGINFNNVYTPSTYTLKSLVGTLCGTSPLVADFNLEVVHELPTPCMPHVLDAMNHINATQDGEGGAAHGFDFLSDPWQSLFLQSATMDFDSEKGLLEYMGYPRQNLVSKEYLQGKQGHVPKHGVSTLPDVNYFSIPETPLEDYLRDAFVSAKKKHERVFLTHLTSTSHHPFGLPEDETYVAVAGQDGLQDLSKYINSIGFDDKWLGKVLAVLDEQGVADETLVVMVGDHGLSMAENDMNSAYYNPNVGNLHVPLVLSHPKLPVINVDDAVTSIQILPTVLDLLVETGSLAPGHARLAKSLATRNYEGQSMIRKLHSASQTTGQGDWQFTVMNPGRAMISVRDSRQAHLRLVIPVIDNSEWSFSDLKLDPTEAKPVLGFEFGGFLQKVEEAHGIEAARWVEEAAFIARWWVEDNSKRWRYGPHRDF
ncbi:hypothetical protein E4U42_000678 [Claviceps africana]|uniref:Sulfatase N-terminal domain-containing protein n=1 Tax=Claviceps africana TaxID=83212 RepID=A0A8K0J030_9HYPO|nr:hypothetical protein E4U42_000678 [Claviceps africana]